MTTPMISEQWPRFLLPIVRKEWYQKMTAVISPVAGLFGVESSSAAAEYSQGIGDMGLIPEYNSSDAEGAPAAIQYGSFQKLFETTFLPKEYAKGLAIERKLWDFDQKGNIRRRAQTLGNATGNTIAYHQSSVFNNAFSATAGHLGADGVALCSATHDMSPSDGTHFVNRGTSALSYAAINTTRAAGLALKADDGTPMPIVYDTLIVPGALESKALEETRGSFVPGQADLTASAINEGKFIRDIIVDPYLTDATNWFMVNKELARLHLLWFWSAKPEMAMAPDSDYTLVAKYRIYLRFMYGWDDPRWIFGHEVAG